MSRNLFKNVLLVGCLSIFGNVSAGSIPLVWSLLDPIIQSRVNQRHQKMKLSAEDAEQFKIFLKGLGESLPALSQLQHSLPKTTLELLMAVNKRGLELKEAEKMAGYLAEVVEGFHFLNAPAFDENTSHIIGREWSEIDYSGEGMTWQKQRAKYQPFGIGHFKSCDNLRKFIRVECKLPYFNKVYRPKNPKACLLTNS